MKRCIDVCVGCYWFENYGEEGEEAPNYICLGTDDTWYSKKEYENLEVPDDCPRQSLQEAMQTEEPIA